MEFSAIAAVTFATKERQMSKERLNESGRTTNKIRLDEWLFWLCLILIVFTLAFAIWRVR